MKFFYFLFSTIGVFVFTACTKDVGANPDLVVKTACDSVTFTLDIKPIFDGKCVSCHVNGTQSGAPWDYTTYAGIKPRVDDGSIRSRVLVIHDMPKDGPVLPQSELDLITCWLDAGAPNN